MSPSIAAKLRLPADLAAWTLATVYNVVRTHEYEPGSFDYKEEPNPTGPKRDEAIDSIRRTACAMANADGGYILFGVRDRHHQVASPDDRVVGMRLGGDLRKSFGDKIRAVQRGVFFDAFPNPLPLPDGPAKGIFVVAVPPSPLRPHMVQSTGVFYRRGEGGTADPMSFYEVREQMLYTQERLRRTTMFWLDVAQLHRQAQAML
jgi:Schlafen, AlbA_2